MTTTVAENSSDVDRSVAPPLPDRVARAEHHDDSRHVLERIFNQALDDQPQCVVDVGGDGSWLAFVASVVLTCERGRHLGARPLTLVGVDSGTAAQGGVAQGVVAQGTAARGALAETLARTSLPFRTFTGSVDDPRALTEAMAANGLDLGDALHIRSYPIHDPGRASPPGSVERQMVHHLRRWEPFLVRHGLLALQSHAVPQGGAGRLDHESWLRCCREAGLEIVFGDTRRYPRGEDVVAASLVRLVARAAGREEWQRQGPSVVREDEWAPEGPTSSDDGEMLHRLMFEGGDVLRPRFWCAPATGWLIREAMQVIERRLRVSEPGETITVVDYGAGTGLATIELIRALRRDGVEQRCADRGVGLRIDLVDLPNEWFAYGYDLLESDPLVHFHSLREDGGKFRSLAELFPDSQVDLILASMVLHLVPVKAIEHLARGSNQCLKPGGRFLWTAPDLGPATPGSVLFHDVNRAVRDKWVARLERGHDGDDLVDYGAARARFSADSRRRASKRVLPQANRTADVWEAILEDLDGSCRSLYSRISHEEILATTLVPSNQRELLPECVDEVERDVLVRELVAECLDELGPSSGGPHGLSLRWTVGDFVSRSVAPPAQRVAPARRDDVRSGG